MRDGNSGRRVATKAGQEVACPVADDMQLPVVRLDNQPQDRATATDERRQEVAKADERGRRRLTRVNEIGGKRWPGRRQTRGNARFGGRQEVCHGQEAMVVSDKM